MVGLVNSFHQGWNFAANPGTQTFRLAILGEKVGKYGVYVYDNIITVIYVDKDQSKKNLNQELCFVLINSANFNLLCV